jgi:putative flavoprotein involved in K+ transport
MRPRTATPRSSDQVNVVQTIDTIIIGAGQAGLAASRLLSEARHEHVVLERRRVGERWLSSSWDSLRLLSPNWMTRLPYWSYSGSEPDGFMTARQVAAFLADYSRSFDVPLETNTTMEHVRVRGDRLEVVANQQLWRARNVVIATGWADQPSIPPLASHLHPDVEQVTPANYRSPGQLPEGGVLIVGASASGVQLADELRRDGRPVYLAVGRHTRMLRRYRGRDIFWWLDQIGALDRSVDEVHSPNDARHEPSMQLIGRSNRANVDLPALAAEGVVLLGRLTAVDATVAYFSNDLQSNTATADERLCALLGRIDRYISAKHLAEDLLPPERPFRRPAPEPLPRMDLRAAGVTSVIWATGHRRDYSWLDVPVLDPDGELTHKYGITPLAGLYVLGQRFQRTRRSNFLDGVGADAVAITQHLLKRSSYANLLIKT